MGARRHAPEGRRMVTTRTRPEARRCRAARACDALLGFCVLAFATWTLAYHACLVLGLGSGVALAVLAAGLVPCGLLAARHEAGSAPARGARPLPPTGGRAPIVLAVALALVVAAAVALAFARRPWPLLWVLWVAAAIAVLIAGARGPLVPPGRSRRSAGAGAGVALAWAAGIAALSLVLVKPNADDAYYLRQAAWIAEHERFPLRDTLHSHDVLPATFSPPLPSFEPLLGTLAGTAGLTVPELAFLVVAPVVSALAVLALWRLLRTWQVRMVAPALSVAIVFLLFAVEPADTDVGLDHLPGDFFVARPWQGKVVLAAVLVPLLFSLLHEHAARRRSLLLLAAAGVAAVGLSTTGTFLIPVVALACLVPAARRAPRHAAAGLAAACAYPAAAMAVALLSEGRQPARWRPQDIAPEALVLPAVGSGLLAFVTVTAALAGPLLLAPRCARLGTAMAALLAALAFAPGVPDLLYDLTGLGRPLWRLMWAMPIAALVGALATQPAAAHPRAAVRLLPALAVGALVALAGTPVWQGRNTGLAGHPALKRDASQLAVATALSGLSRDGDVVLAPAGVSSTLLMIDGRVNAVAPRLLYTQALPPTPQAQRAERLLLWSFVNAGLTPGVREDAVTSALRRLGVDIACVKEYATRGRRLLAGAGYGEVLLRRGIWCGSAGYRAALDRAPGEFGPLAVLRHVADPEAVEQHVQVAFYGVDAQEQRVGDLAVRGGPRVRV
jgi:hypothetical protein